ncbi:heme-binding protein [Streptomyces wuyuanensis]|uniref:heme-binding protein n=1 Tax=Streptomyces wuyuanensis TaxID=1196353 RepID=UPI003D715610
MGLHRRLADEQRTGRSAAKASAPAAAVPAAVKVDAANRNLHRTTHLTVAAAIRAAQAVLETARGENQRVTVAVVDRNGNTVVVLCGDGAGPQSYESAERRAHTAALPGRRCAVLLAPRARRAVVRKIIRTARRSRTFRT